MAISIPEFTKLKPGTIIKRVVQHPDKPGSAKNITQGKKYKIIKIVLGPKYSGEDTFWIVNDAGKISKLRFEVSGQYWDVVSF